METSEQHPVSAEIGAAPGAGPSEIIAHTAWGFDVQIVPAWSKRDWMDATDKGFAYHCLPMLLANQSGWFILAPHGAVVQWNGGADYKDLKVEILGNPHSVHAMSRVGSGILSWTIPYVFRTPPGWNMLCRGPANYVKDGIAPLEGLIETDWTHASFSANWKMTRPGRVEFSAGEPIAMLVPHRREDLEQFTARKALLSENPALAEGYQKWISSRRGFLMAQAHGDAKMLKERFQKHYFNGKSVAGDAFDQHQKKRDLATFALPREIAQPSRPPNEESSVEAAHTGEFVAYVLSDPSEMPIEPAPSPRAWMEQTDNRFAYRCLPLSIANQSGWIMRSPVSFTAVWNGGHAKSDLDLVFEGGPDPRAKSHFGSGIITFGLPYLFRTPRGTNLWVKGPANYFKDGACALEAVVETDWSVAPFTMNWKCTRVGHPVHFERGEPICMVVPVARELAESLNPRYAAITESPQLARAVEAWQASRGAFIEGLERGDPETRKRGWERHYIQGSAPDGTRGPEHQTKLKLKPFGAVPAKSDMAVRERAEKAHEEPESEPPPVRLAPSPELDLHLDERVCPRAFERVEQWALDHGRPMEEARLRFFHYAAICSVACDEALGGEVVLRGAGAMWLAYGNARTTDDLDFIALRYRAETAPPGFRERLAARVGKALSYGMRRYVVDFPAWRERLLGAIKVEVSPCYTNPGNRQVVLDNAGLRIRVADLEYLLAEKVAALGQQFSRGKRRTKDPYDIACMLRAHGASIDRQKTVRYVQHRLKSEGGETIGLRQFDERLKAKIAPPGADDPGSAIVHAIPFEEAWHSLLKFVSELEAAGLAAASARRPA